MRGKDARAGLRLPTEAEMDLMDVDSLMLEPTAEHVVMM